ncbi:MAG: plasmid stabilization protein [Rhodospirillales bacterium]|jgi:antitoxin FitA|nr:plasmid stabilization protein [Rhodospirillales bacterium]MBT4039007.1 plasmid stabilization protein [Rhodospirillales bacterium]MBT4628177.1 plasmid stabilization protein [Rhodospirillales bacterium]MBT5522155.1 plasmid stabilization protein [Rhodospirillales bacterium]MBT6110732.1 plasmid stabilization protein [Rhodospirillales bacterium]
MASITIRNLDDKLKHSLRVQAAYNSRSMEDEARDILRNSLATRRRQSTSLAEAVRQRFAPFGGIDIVIHPREPMPEPPRFDE